MKDSIKWTEWQMYQQNYRIANFIFRNLYFISGDLMQD